MQKSEFKTLKTIKHLLTLNGTSFIKKLTKSQNQAHRLFSVSYQSVISQRRNSLIKIFSALVEFLSKIFSD